MPEEKRGYMGRLETILLIIVGLLVIFMLCLMFIPVVVNAGEIHGDFSVGYITENDDFSTDLSISYELWIMEISGGIETLMERSPESPLFFCPYRNTYYIDCQIQPFRHLYFDFSHSCTHPVYSYDKQFWDKFEGGNRTTLKMGVQW